MFADKNYLVPGTIRIHSNLHINTLDVTCIIFLLLATIITFLWNFDAAVPLQFWDESRNANNALEMALGNNWLIPTYNDLPDHWNTKPPLLIWTMALGIKLGLSPLLAVRLPSLIALVATLIMVWAFLYFVLKNRFAALFACVLMLSSTLFVGVHGARTGDYDSMLAFFTTAYVLSFWLFSANKHALKFEWLIATGALVFCAVLTKGIAGFFGLIGIALFCVLNGTLFSLIKIWRFWLVLAVTISLCLSYYFIRELYDSGYLGMVWANELGGRYFETNEFHYKTPYFYVTEFAHRFEPGFLCVVMAIFIQRRRHNLQARTLEKLCFFAGLGIFLLLTLAKTHLRWYAIPIVPLWSMVAAIAISDIFYAFKQRYFHSKKLIINALVFGCLALLTINFVYENIVSIPHKVTKDGDPNTYGIFFKNLHANRLMPASLLVIDGGVDELKYNPVLKFYARIEKLEGININVSDVIRYDSELIASCDKAKINYIKSLELLPLYDNGSCILAKNPLNSFSNL